MGPNRGGEADASHSGLRSSPARSLRALALDRTVASCWYWGERLFVVVVLSTYAGSLMAILASVSSVNSSESARRLALLFAFLFAGLVAFSHPVAFLRTLSRHAWTGLLVLLALASSAWSAAPDLTLKRGLMLLGTTLLGVYLATRFRPRDILALLAV